MRAHVLLTIPLLALPLAQPAAAQAQPQREIRFQAMDGNGDGVITRAEWRGSDRSFRVHDWNDDGRLAGDEVRIGGARRRAAGDDDFDAARARDFNDWTEEGFRSHDHDGDGRIARGEWHYDRESFRRADRNADGILTRNEFLAIDTDIDREDRFDYLDADNDGRVERGEWHASRDAFAWLDRNNDGVLSRAEVVEDTAGEADLFADLDNDRDGRISAAEWHWSRRSFERRDRNNDGQLTRAEMGSLASATGPDAVGTSGRAIVVDATQRWVDTGIDLRAGDSVTLQADGSIGLSSDRNDRANPSGSVTGRRAQDAPLRNQAAGALIARVGEASPIFVGSSGTIDRVRAGGRLYLSVNDDHLGDNSGEYRVTIAVDRR